MVRTWRSSPNELQENAYSKRGGNLLAEAVHEREAVRIQEASPKGSSICGTQIDPVWPIAFGVTDVSREDQERSSG